MKYDTQFLELIRQGRFSCDESGVIRSSTGQMLSTADCSGYVRVGYVVSHHPYKKISIRGHRLVWLYHNGPIPPGMVVNHKNGVKTDNRLSNLELLTIGDNNRYKLGLSLTGDGGAFAFTPKSDINDALLKVMQTGKYRCDVNGNIHSTAKNRRLVPFRVGEYLAVSLQLGLLKNGNSIRVHRAVWTYFHGRIPDGMVINHKNGNKLDNRLENLECVSHADNIKHAYQQLGAINFAGELSPNAKLTDEAVLEIRRQFAERTADKAALLSEYKITASNMADVLSYRCYKRVGLEYREACKERNAENKVGKARFTDEQIIGIFRDHASGLGYRKLAAKYGGNPEGIMRIITRKSYRHVLVP